MEATLKYRGRVIIKGIAPFINEKTRVLDIGCGNGVISHQIREYFNCSIVGTDVWEYLKRDIEFKKMSKEDKLDFGDDEFDVGLFNDVLHHIPWERHITLLKEALRVCAKVLLFEARPTFMAKLVEFPLNWINNINVSNPLTHRNEKDWQELFENNNIAYELYPVRKPSFWYPFINFIFCLTNPRYLPQPSK